MNVLDNYTDNNNLISIDIDFKMSVLFPNLKKNPSKFEKGKRKNCPYKRIGFVALKWY